MIAIPNIYARRSQFLLSWGCARKRGTSPRGISNVAAASRTPGGGSVSRLDRRARAPRHASHRSAPSPARAERLEERRLLSAALLKDINPQGFGSISAWFTPYHDALYFSGDRLQ